MIKLTMLATAILEELSDNIDIETMELLIKKGAIPTTDDLRKFMSDSWDVDIIKLFVERTPANKDCFLETFNGVTFEKSEILEKVYKVIEVLLTNYKLDDNEKIEIIKKSRGFNTKITDLLVKEFMKSEPDVNISPEPKVEDELLHACRFNNVEKVKEILNKTDLKYCSLVPVDIPIARYFCYNKGLWEIYALIDKSLYDVALGSDFLSLCSINDSHALDIAPYIGKDLRKQGIKYASQNRYYELVYKLSIIE